MNEAPKKPRGFAAISKEYQRELAKRGGAAVPNDKRSFSKSRELASRAGKIGGLSGHGPARDQ